jgi:hypothetical protein
VDVQFEMALATTDRDGGGVASRERMISPQDAAA